MTDLFDGSPDHGDVEVKLDDLVGDGKKFKTVEELARGKLESDRFIQQLQGELKGLRDELGTRVKLEEFMDKLSNSQKPDQTMDTGHNQNREGGNEVTALKPEDIRKLLDEELQKRESVSAAQRNLEAVKGKLVDSFGPNYASRLEQEASKLGVTKDFLNNLAASQPNAFLRLVGADTGVQRKTEDIFTPPTSQLQLRNPGTLERNQSYYNKMKQDNPKEYWTPAVQNQLHKDALRLGETFFT